MEDFHNKDSSNSLSSNSNSQSYHEWDNTLIFLENWNIIWIHSSFTKHHVQVIASDRRSCETTHGAHLGPHKSWVRWGIIWSKWDQLIYKSYRSSSLFDHPNPLKVQWFYSTSFFFLSFPSNSCLIWIGVKSIGSMMVIGDELIKGTREAQVAHWLAHTPPDISRGALKLVQKQSFMAIPFMLFSNPAALSASSSYQI